MSANAYLNSIANAAIVRDTERDSIKRSVVAIQTRLKQHFGNDLKGQSIFGSFERKTMLPRSMDDCSDIDLLLVFETDGAKPQTYIERLRRFAEARYPSSQIARSHPTVVLELLHMRFELVPAINTFWGGLQIPAPRSDWQDWMDCDPHSLGEKLRAKDKSHDSMIRKLVRVMKYWNVCNGRPYASHDLEQRTVGTGYQTYFDYYVLDKRMSLLDYFVRFVEVAADDGCTFLERGTPRLLRG